MNEYQRAKLQLEDNKCPTCSGLGYCEDAGFGDIYYNTWKCSNCNGTGLLTKKEAHGYSTSK